jgi:hypothetical protein
MVFRFSRWHLSLALRGGATCRVSPAHSIPVLRPGTHSLVMNEMNSDTHSCTVSFASFAIFALCGSAFFIIRLQPKVHCW